MSATAFFVRTLLRASAVFAGVSLVFLNPSLEWRAPSHTAVVAQQAPREEAIAALVEALKDSDAGVRAQAARALARLRAPSGTRVP